MFPFIHKPSFRIPSIRINSLLRSISSFLYFSLFLCLYHRLDQTTLVQTELTFSLIERLIKYPFNFSTQLFKS